MTPPRSLSPQLHSGDRKIRLSPRDLRGLVLTHLDSGGNAQQLPDAGTTDRNCHRTGWTEWHGQVDGKPSSLAWDWVEVAPGCLQVDRTVPPRTNMHVIDAKGYDLGLEVSDQALFGWIDGFPWQDAVAGALAAAFAASPNDDQAQEMARTGAPARFALRDARWGEPT